MQVRRAANTIAIACLALLAAAGAAYSGKVWVGVGVTSGGQNYEAIPQDHRLSQKELWSDSDALFGVLSADYEISRAAMDIASKDVRTLVGLRLLYHRERDNDCDRFGWYGFSADWLCAIPVLSFAIGPLADQGPLSYVGLWLSAGYGIQWLRVDGVPIMDRHAWREPSPHKCSDVFPVAVAEVGCTLNLTGSTDLLISRMHFGPNEWALRFAVRVPLSELYRKE